MSVEEISVQALHDLGAEASLVDVREDGEYAAGHVPYASHVPLGSVPEHVDSFGGSPTYVICRSGARSMQACEFLAAKGCSVVNVAGGTMAWAEAGFELQGGNV